MQDTKPSPVADRLVDERRRCQSQRRDSPNIACVLLLACDHLTDQQQVCHPRKASADRHPSLKRREFGLRLFRQRRADEAVGALDPLAQLRLRRRPWQQDPGSVKIGRLHAGAGLDQPCRRFDAVGLDRDAGRLRSDAGEHLAADFPRIMPAAPGVADDGAGELLADGVDGCAAHRARLADMARGGHVRRRRRRGRSCGRGVVNRLDHGAQFLNRAR